MSLTLNQVVARIQSLSLAHKQINSFFFGDLPEFTANGEITYPACFCEQQPGSISRVEKQQRLNFRVYFLDLVGVSEDTKGNETEVLSDMTSVANDFMAMLMASEYDADWMIVDTANVTPVTEYLEDMVAGVYLEVGILVDFLADRCQVPADDVTFETDFDMARTKILTYTGTGSEGDSFTVSGLAGKIVLATYRAGSYKRGIVTTPTDSDKIKIDGTDLGSNKGILATGSVSLQVGDGLTGGEVLDFLIWSI